MGVDDVTDDAEADAAAAHLGIHGAPAAVEGFEDVRQIVRVDAEATIRGHAVNVAARMEQTAPPGALRISDSTYRHVRGVFDVDVQPPLQVKGLEDRW